MTTQDVLGLTAALLVVVSEVIYIRSIYKADPMTGSVTRPSRSTFWIWTVVQGMMAASYIASGEGFAAGLSVAYALCFLVIAVISLRKGYSQWSRLDTSCVVGVGVITLVWIISRDPFLTLAASIGTDLIGAIPTMSKARVEPASESRLAWTLTVVATLINFGAVSAWGASDVLYNVYLLFVNGWIAAATWLPVKPKEVSTLRH